MNDQVLIQQFLEGDIGAFNRLVRRWEAPLYGFVYRTLGHRELAKDVCQGVFIRVYKQLKNLREPDKFVSWLYRIALNLCRDELKKMKKGRLMYLEDIFGSPGGENTERSLPDRDNPTPEETIHRMQLGDILKQVMMGIPEEQRVVIIMKQYQELKFTEIADILGEPVNTVKSRLYYGLRAMRKILEESPYSKEVLLHEM